MKKVLFAAAVLLSAAFAQAQSIHPRVEVGANIANGITKLSDVKVDSKAVVGFRAGVSAEIDLASGIYLAPGLYFKQEGYKFKNADEKARLDYLSIPVNLGIRVGLDNLLAVSVEAGPSFSYGISASEKSYFSENPAYKRFDMGINASAAIEYSRAFLRVGADLGLVNNLKNALAKSSYRNTSFFVGVGYRF